MRRKALVLAALLALCGLLAATSPAAAQGDGEAMRTADDRLASVAAEAPAFGGMRVDQARETLVVHLVRPAKGGEAKRERVRRALRAEYGAAELPYTANIRVLPARFSIGELAGWYERAGELFGIDGLVFTDLNEGRNRIEVGVSSAEARAAVRDRLAELEIPPAAVVLTHTDPVRPESSLRSHHRPLVGGLQLTVSTPRESFICTYGFSARRQGLWGFVINSHCTEEFGENRFTVFHQPSPAAQAVNRIGREEVDPPLFRGGECFPGFRCRWSDAAWAGRRWGTESVNEIARVPLGSLWYNNTNRFLIRAKGNVAQGAIVNKVGRTTGRTRGQVTNTCMHVQQFGTNIVLLCQNQAAYGSAGGDSGSPVFQWVSNPDPEEFDASFARLVGIHWGSGGTHSPLPNIQTDLGWMRVCSAGFSC